MPDFQDLFSSHAACYAHSRPTYPPELFEYLAGLVTDHQLAWDVGTGNGQAAIGLSEHFEYVIATDASRGQIEHARVHPRVEYRVATAEDADLPSASVDLITIAQALHWLRLDDFYVNVRRVAKPNGVIAAWCYTLPRVTREVDAACDWFYRDVTRPYWEPGRRFIDERYETIAFPFGELPSSASRPASQFECLRDWSLSDYLGYIRSWSAVQACLRERGIDPVREAAGTFSVAWGKPELIRAVRWPIYMRVGRVHGG